MESPILSLYHYEGCPFCTLVRDAMGRLGRDIELRDILVDGERREELIAATGRQMVPCLRIEDGLGEVRWMHESRDIIRYLEAL
jgi:glutaredoxin 2